MQCVLAELCQKGEAMCCGNNAQGTDAVDNHSLLISCPFAVQDVVLCVNMAEGMLGELCLKGRPCNIETEPRGLLLSKPPSC